jgi:hypothetical protein
MEDVMKPSRFLVLTMFLSTVVLSPAAHAVIDADATVVKLRTSCNEGGTTLNNCFVALETIGGNPLSGLQAWVDARASNAPPLVIEIGPGTFKNFNCDNKNDISLKGSGPEVTKLSGTILSYGIQAWNCQRFNVQDLSVVSPGFAVVWNGTGSSRWTNVTVEGADLGAWVDGLDPTGCPAVTNTTKPVHYWFNSRLRGRGQNYIAYCSENWFFGSEFTVTGKSGFFTSSSSALVVGTSGASTTAKPEVHVYGSVVRVMVGTSDSYPAPTPGVTNGVIAVVASKDGEVHLHGTGIDVINTGGLGSTIAALSAYEGGSIHAHGSAYNLKKGNGTSAKVVRILADTNPATHVHAPYQWEEHTTLPVITSVTGADMAIETDCAATGCTTVGTEAHLFIYRTACTGANGPWWDIIAKKCR